MRATTWLLMLVLAAIFAVAGCSEDSTAPETTTSPSLIEGEIGAADFEITLGATKAEGI